MKRERAAILLWTLMGLIGFISAACDSQGTNVLPTPSATAVAPTRAAGPLTATITPTAHTFATPTPMASNTPPPEISISATPIPTVVPSLQPMTFTLDTLCPTNPSISIDQLGLSAQSRVLLVPDTLESIWDDSQQGLFFVSSDTTQPKPWTLFIQNGQTNSRGYRVSPNGLWVVFQRKPMGSDQGSAWISSIDGKQQWALSSNSQLQNWIWLDDDILLLFDTARKTYAVMDPFTKQGRVLSNLPPTHINGVGALFFRSAGHTYMIYQSGQDYRLFDSDTGEDQDVLSWLRDEFVPMSDKYITVRPGGLVIVRVKRPYGFDMSAVMSLNDLVKSTSYAETMQPVVLPPVILPASVTDDYSANNMGTIMVAEAGNNRAYWLDFKNRQVRDFCFDQGDIAGVSSDGQFAAFVHLSLPHTQPIPKSTYILNMETGFYSRIDHFQFMAWVDPIS